jgi:carboxyl-terminal processing protease
MGMYRHTVIWIILSGVIAMMFVQLPQMAAKQDAVLNTYSALVEVDALARQKFVEPFEDNRLVEGAIRGMMLQLDPYSGYIAPHELAAFERRTHGDFIGVGIEVGMVDGVPTVIAPIEGSPAAKAGVRAGDGIVAVQGHDVKGLSVFDIEERLSGKPDTPVHLSLKRAGSDEPIDLIIARGPVTLGTVRGFRRTESEEWDFRVPGAERVAYIRVSSFYENTLRDFDAALRDIRGQGAQALILDLRFNPGGLMQQAVEMADRFLGDGLILSTVTRRRAVQEYYATTEETDSGLRLVVLINRFSASSSEIVAGSLQDHQRAMIVGERSFGKGSVQHLIHLNGQKAAVKLTVACYRLPGGRIIHRGPKNAPSESWGVRPDVEVLLSDEETRGIQETRRLLDMPPALQDSSAAGGNPTDPPTPIAFPGPIELPLDRQLQKALSLLEGG